jgi:hypothetical protein
MPKVSKKEGNIIYVTKDYSIFKTVKGNRAIDKAHVAKLKKEIQKKDLDLPIYVNEHDEVVDGQHTLQARKELNKPIRYIRGAFENEFDVATMNANRKNWSNKDYLEFHIQNGKKEYSIIKSLMRQYAISLESVLILSSGNYSVLRSVRSDFKSGKYKIEALQRCNEIGSDLMYMKNHYNIRITRAFVTAYAIVKEHPSFRWDRFKTALKSKSAMLLRGTNTEDFITVFEKIYNSGSRTKVHFVRYFLDKDYQDEDQE